MRHISRQEIVGAHVSPLRKRTGIGKQLGAALEQTAIEAGIMETVVQSSTHAVDFYRHSGYQPIKGIKFELNNGVRLDAMLMHKNLTRQ